MFELFSKLAEILSSYWERFLDGRQLNRDADVARHLVSVVVALQDLCVRGERLLVLAAEFLDGDGSADRVHAEITSARADVARAKQYCSTLQDAIETAIGPEAMTRLRRKLRP